MQGLKDMVASAITKELEGIRQQFLQLMDQNNETLSEEIQLGATRARAKARILFSKVQQSLGIS